jgi:hypothetical protein
MTRTDYDELESQTQIQKVAFDLCLKIAGNSIQANKLFSFVRPYLREFIKISPQLLTYAEKLSRRSAEDINNYFRKILVKDGVYYTPENPEITLTNFIDTPISFDRITTKPDEQIAEAKMIEKNRLLLQRMKQEEEAMKQAEDNQRYHQNYKDFVSNNIEDINDKKNMMTLQRLLRELKEEEETNNMMDADRESIMREVKDMRDVQYKKELEALKDTPGNESKEEVGTEMNVILPKSMKQLLGYNRQEMNNVYLYLQRQHPDILSDNVETLKTKQIVADEINKILQFETVDNQVITRAKKTKQPKDETPENPKKVIQPPVMDTKPKEDYTTPVKNDVFTTPIKNDAFTTPIKNDKTIDLKEYSKSQLKLKSREYMLDKVKDLFNNDSFFLDFNKTVEDIIKNPDNYSNTQLRNILNRDNLEKNIISKQAYKPDTPALKEGKGLMKSNLSILNKFKYR